MEEKILEGEVKISECEGGFASSCLSIGDVDDFVNWFGDEFGNVGTCGRYGAGDEEIKGKFRITVEKIEE